MPVYTLTPTDVLFFRDGRPMEVAGGHGARWPEPSLIFDAIHAALHRAFPQTQGWEHSHRYGVSSDRDYNRKETQRFGSLKTVGLFPVLENGCWLFPSPLDIVPSKDARLQLLRPLRPDIHSGRDDNLPPPLSYSLGSPCAPSKEGAEPWWSRAAYEAYLRNKRPATDETKTDVALLAGEWITGIRIDPETETTGQGEAAGQIYSAEYLRLRPEVRMGFVATLPVRLNGSTNNVQECIGKLLGENGTIVVGGQQRVCSVAPLQGGGDLCRILPTSIQIHGERVKWVLLTPAVFPAIPAGLTKNGDPIKAHPGGWLPTWVDPETGGVKLLAGGPGKEKAKRLKADPGKEIEAKLVAARIPKPIVITGWSEKVNATKPYGQKDNKGARPTLLAVPAGAVYYFQGKDAPLLADALSWHGTHRENAASIVNRRSTLMGEKGFGLGVCGTWDFYEDVLGRRENPDPNFKELN
jgi:CRISPR-associated protein Cmr3